MSFCTVDGRAVMLKDPLISTSSTPPTLPINQNANDPRILPASQLAQIQVDLYSPMDKSSLESISRQLLDHSLAINAIRSQEQSQLQQKFTAQLTENEQKYQVEKNDILKQGFTLKNKLISCGKIAVEISDKANGGFSSIGSTYDSCGLYRADGRMAGNFSNGPEKLESELEMDNRLLKSDVRFLRTRVRESDVQVLRMESEIKQLRASLLGSAPFISIENEITYESPRLPSSSFSTAPRLSEITSLDLNQAHNIRKRSSMMGDAEAEHLLLAGKKLSHIRRIHKVPISQAIVTQAHEIISWKNGHMYEDGDQEEIPAARMRKVTIDSTTKTPPGSPIKSRSTQPTTPGPPKSPKKSIQSPSRPITPRRIVSPGLKVELTSPGKVTGMSGQFDALRGLVEAAVSLTPGGRERETSELNSPKRQKFNLDQHMDQRQSESTVGSKMHHLSNIDVRLANGGGSHYRTEPIPSGSGSAPPPHLAPNPFNHGPLSSGFQGPRSSGFHGPSNGFHSRDVGPKVSNDVGDWSSALEVLASAASSQGQPSGSGSSGLLPGFNPPPYIPPPVPSTSANPPAPVYQKLPVHNSPFKRPRSPYIRWEKAEDELLVKAIIANGQRWDNVALQVPSRSYHQVRQRWIRGLKSGDALPDDLKHLQGAVKNAIRTYEAARAKNKNKVMEFSEDEMVEDML